MAVTVFKDASYNLTGLLSRIEHGDIALPDIQRPFVWSNARVRDLFDSMYKGFPVGYLLLWSTGADTGAKQIGSEAKQGVPSLLIVDGQQRLTSLYAVITGTPVVRKDYKTSRIRVAFRPSDQLFEVTDAAVENDPEYIPDISVVFKGAFYKFVNGFLERLEEYRGEEIDENEKDSLVEAIDRLKDLQNYPFQAIELDKTVDEEHVAEVFVRINSQGVQLSAADFILTLMSVFWEQGRKQLEDFARAAKNPSTGGASPFNHFIKPSPDQLLRTAVGLAFRRGRLKYVYSILRGKDLETGEFSPERREAQFEALQTAQAATLDLTNWHEFLRCMQLAGYRSSRMVSSETALMYVYIIWLLGRHDFDVELKRLREVIARWWFMAHTTSRYTGSSETQIEADLNRIRDLKDGDADAYCDLLDRTVRDTFTKDYWEITLPNRLDTSSAKSPPLAAYWASLNILGAEVLFSDLKVSEMLDPVVTAKKDMERHHLYPKSYLKSTGIKERPRVNAIGNMAFVDWTDNLAIADQPPAEYWPIMTQALDEKRLERQMYWHALPRGWEQLTYDEFLEKRRRLIARVIRDAFQMLWGKREASVSEDVSVLELINAGESNVLEFKQSARWSYNTDQKGKSEQIIAKTVSGFLNSEGGTLLIGVSDEGEVKGIEADFNSMKKGDRDAYELFIVGIIKDKVSGPSASLCRVSFESVDGKDVCRVDAGASAKPVFTKLQNGQAYSDFWVRQGNQTAQIHGADQQQYIKDHWG